MTNEVEEEAQLRREMDEDVAELRENHERANHQRAEVYETELAEWKAYEKARVSLSQFSYMYYPYNPLLKLNVNCLVLCAEKGSSQN